METTVPIRKRRRKEELQNERNERKAYYKSWTKEKIKKMTQDEFVEYIGKLWSMIVWGNKKYIADKIRLLINFDTFDRFRTYIFELMKQGFVFDIFLDDKFNYSSENIEYLVTFEKIFMLKDKYYYKDMTNNDKIKGRIEIVDGVV